MKKYVQFSILSLLLIMIGGITNAQNWVNLGSSTPKEISATVTESNSQSIHVLFSTQGFYSESINEGNVTYQRLSIPKASRSQTVGFPELPSFRQMVAIPECSDVSLSFQVLQEQVLNNYNVYPAPDHQVITNPDSTCYIAEVFSKNALCYVDNLVSPSNNVELSETGHFRSQKYAEIQVSPIRYNPATQKLYVAKEIEVTLTLTNATGATSANLGIFNNVAAHTMLNYESTGMTAEVNDMRLDGGSVTFYNLRSTSDAEDINVDYLIICASQFIDVGVGGVLKPSDELQSFAQYRAYYNGYDVGIVGVNNILDLDFQYTATDYHTICEEKMRSFLGIVYENGNASHTYDGHLGFVLLVGRAPNDYPIPLQSPNFYNGFVPSSYSHGVSYHDNNSSYVYPSDYYFSCIQQDHVGDFFIGRFCVENETQLHNIAAKTMKREREYRPRETKVMDFAKGNSLTYDYSLYCRNMRSLLGPDKVLDSVIFDIENNAQTYKNKVYEMLSKGAPFFTIYNHAWSWAWEDLEGFNSNINNGSTMCQFCNSISCNTGRIDAANSLAQSSTTNDSLKGFVGFLGAGRPVLNGYFDELPSAIYNSLSHIMGECVLEAKLLGEQGLRYQYNLVGDPALNIMARGFEVTTDVYLDLITDIRNPIIVKDGGSINISKLSLVRFYDNGSLTIKPTGSINIGQNVTFDGSLAINPFISVQGGNNLNAGSNVTFNNISINFSNPSYGNNAAYSLNKMVFNSSPISFGALSINLSNCSFYQGSGICSDHCNMDIRNCSFNRSNTVFLNTPIGIPAGGSLPTRRVAIDGSTFEDCTSITYHQSGPERPLSSSDAAIRIENIPNYVLNGNSISGCLEGIHLTRSGSGTEHSVSNNVIENNNKDGIIIYNSYADLFLNQITGNGLSLNSTEVYNGISIYNNSSTSVGSTSGNSNNYQLIGQNGKHQIYASQFAFPHLFKYNKVIGNGNDNYSWVYYDVRLSENSDNNTIDVSYNNWDGNVNFDEDIVFNNPQLFTWYPFWEMAKSNDELSEAELLFNQAMQDFADSLYVKAEWGFHQIISMYPQTPYSVSAMKELFRLEQFTNDDYSQLKTFFLTNVNILNDIALSKVGGFLSARCDVHEKNYEDALEWYATQLNHGNISYQDSVFCVIDIGDIYFMMEEDSLSKAGLPSWYLEHDEILPKSRMDYLNKCKYLLSSLPYGETSAPLNSEVKEQEEEFYTCTKWYDSKINFVRYSNHFKDVEVVRMMDTQQNEPDNLVIYDWDIIQDATAGVVYGVDHNMHTDSAYVSTDFGHTWTAISPSRVDNHPVYFWTFPNSPGVIAKGNQWSDFQVSNDFGSHFEAMETGPLSNCFSGWSNGEFFDLFWQVDKGMMLHRTPDYYQTLETINQTLPEYHWNYLGAVEGEFYKLFYAGPESNEARLYYSNDYGQNCRLLMEFDSTAVSTPLHGEGSWSVWIGQEPGVFYTFKREYRYNAPEEGTKIYIDYYRSYGDTLVTTYFHHFAPDWFDHHTPIMECELVSCDNRGVTLHWNEPELRPEEVLVGYRVYRGEDLVSDLITETEYIDPYSGGGRLKYHVLAVYSDGETSKSYNIVYCEQTDGVDENEEETKVVVFPNPANWVVKIEGVIADEVQVYNALGQVMKTVRRTNEVDLSGLVEGVYLVRITDMKGISYTKRITVIR